MNDHQTLDADPAEANIPHRMPPATTNNYMDVVWPRAAKAVMLPLLMQTWQAHGRELTTKADFLRVFQEDHGFSMSSAHFNKLLKDLGLTTRNALVVEGWPAPPTVPQPYRHPVYPSIEPGFRAPLEVTCRPTDPDAFDNEGPNDGGFSAERSSALIPPSVWAEGQGA